MKEILPNIFLITEKGLFKSLKPPVNIFVIAGENGLIYDAGYGDGKSIDFFIKEITAIKNYCKDKGIPCNITRILVSHSHGDHFSGIEKIHNNLGYEILLTEKMAERVTSEKKYRESYEYDTVYNENITGSTVVKFLSRVLHPFIVAYYKKMFGIEFVKSSYTVIEEKSKVNINGESWRIFPSPGHAEDHISLYDPKRGILFGGDNILNSITTWLGPPNSDIDKYTHSLTEILNLPKLKTILTSHGSPITNPQKRIQEIIDWRELRTSQVLEIISRSGEKGTTMKGVLLSLYSRSQFIKYKLAEGWVKLTLEYLVEKKLAMSRIEKGRTVYYI